MLIILKGTVTASATDTNSFFAFSLITLKESLRTKVCLYIANAKTKAVFLKKIEPPLNMNSILLFVKIYMIRKATSFSRSLSDSANVA